MVVSRSHGAKAVVARTRGQVRTLGGARGRPESRCGAHYRLLLVKLVAYEAILLILLLPLI